MRADPPGAVTIQAVRKKTVYPSNGLVKLTFMNYPESSFALMLTKLMLRYHIHPIQLLTRTVTSFL